MSLNDLKENSNAIVVIVAILLTMLFHMWVTAKVFGRHLVTKLKDMGYEEVKLVDTTNGMFMSKWESIWMGLSGSAIRMGKK